MIVDSYVKKNWSRIPSDSLDVYEDDFVGVISLFIALIYILYPCLSCLYVVIFFIKPIAKLMFWLTVALVWYYHLHYRNVSHLNPYIWLLVVSCIFDSLTLDFLRIILVLTSSNKISFLIRINIIIHYDITAISSYICLSRCKFCKYIIIYYNRSYVHYLFNDQYIHFCACKV